MEKKLRAYVEDLFADTPKTRRALELKDELAQNLIDRYRDQIEKGKSEDEAYNAAASSIGDINVLLRDIENEYDPRAEKANTRSAMLTAVAIMLYILSIVPPILSQGYAGGLLFIFFIAAATGILVYSNMTKPKYRRSDDTVVEEFKEWQNQQTDNKAVFKAVSSAIWSVTVALYFLISLLTMKWWITWIIFLIASAVIQIVKVFFEMRRH